LTKLAEEKKERKKVSVGARTSTSSREARAFIVHHKGIHRPEAEGRIRSPRLAPSLASVRVRD